MKNLFIFLCFFFSQPLLHSNDSIPEFHVISIAKSGTHLLLKTITYLTNYEPIFASIPSNLSKRNQYYWGHFPLSDWECHFYSQKKLILLVRDPRDICVSMLHTILKSKGLQPGSQLDAFHLDKSQCDFFKTLSFDDQLMYLIKNNLPVFPLTESLPDAIKQTHKKNTLLIRFENLVGESGGGSLTSQIEEIKKIALFLKIPFSEHLLKLIAHDLYGIKSVETTFLAHTFREGKIGSWKTSFNDAHKKEFKNRFGRYLILLGYEKNNDW